MGRFVKATDVLMEYLSRLGAREVPDKFTAAKRPEMPMGMMQIAPEQGAFSLLARLTNAKHYVEIGTFTGYSALSIALAMPPDGKVVARREQIHRSCARLLEGGRVQGKIDLRLGPGRRARQDDRGRRGSVRSRLPLMRTKPTTTFTTSACSNFCGRAD